MFGPEMETKIQVITFDNQQRLKQAERHRRFTQAIAGEQQAAQPQHHRFGDFVRRLSFRNRPAPTGAAS
ncbi:MAG: hypothetical protein ACJ789_09425 [Thermomicrobiales bacterium]